VAEILFFSRLLGGSLASSRLWHEITKSLSSLWWGGGLRYKSLGACRIQGQMLLLHVTLNEFMEFHPAMVINWFSDLVVSVMMGLSLGRVGDGPAWLLHLIFFSKLDGSVEFVGSITILVTNINPNGDSTEQVVFAINTSNFYLQRHCVELMSRLHINGILHHSHMIALLGNSTSGGEHPLQFRLHGISVPFPLKLPPGELLLSDHHHLLEPVDFVFLSLPGVLHLLDDLSVSLLL